MKVICKKCKTSFDSEFAVCPKCGTLMSEEIEHKTKQKVSKQSPSLGLAALLCALITISLFVLNITGFYSLTTQPPESPMDISDMVGSSVAEAAQFGPVVIIDFEFSEYDQDLIVKIFPDKQWYQTNPIWVILSLGEPAVDALDWTNCRYEFVKNSLESLGYSVIMRLVKDTSPANNATTEFLKGDSDSNPDFAPDSDPDPDPAPNPDFSSDLVLLITGQYYITDELVETVLAPGETLPHRATIVFEVRRDTELSDDSTFKCHMPILAGLTLEQAKARLTECGVIVSDTNIHSIIQTTIFCEKEMVVSTYPIAGTEISKNETIYITTGSIHE